MNTQLFRVDNGGAREPAPAFRSRSEAGAITTSGAAIKTLNLFYSEERRADRWVPFDRYARACVRRLVYGRPRPSGQYRMFLNLCAGLDRIGAKYRVNDFRRARQHPEETACIVGKPSVLDRMQWQNPILFGAAVFDHPSIAPDLLERWPIKKVLVPGEWMRRMCEPYWGESVVAWPVGIDTERWKPDATQIKDIDVLFYDKVRWRHKEYEHALIAPLRARLAQENLTVKELRYGFYREEDFRKLLKRARAMVFLCEHETQGIAYQQALASGVPIFAWDRGGPWQDYAYYPHKVVFGPVSSVPYWDARCGEKFQDAKDFLERWTGFRTAVDEGRYASRDYILENLTLEKCARDYLNIATEIGNSP